MPAPMLQSLQSVLGIIAFVAVAWTVSEHRRAFPWRIVLAGLGLELILAAALLKLPVFELSSSPPSWC